MTFRSQPEPVENLFLLIRSQEANPPRLREGLHVDIGLTVPGRWGTRPESPRLNCCSWSQHHGVSKHLNLEPRDAHRFTLTEALAFLCLSPNDLQDQMPRSRFSRKRGDEEQLVPEDKSIPTVSAAREAQRNSLHTEIITLQQQLFNSFPH